MDEGALGLCILINQRQRNTAIGVSQDTHLLRGLSAYVRSIHKANTDDTIQTIVKASYLKAMVEEYHALAGRLTDYIMENIEDDDIRNEGVYAMTKLEAYVTHLGDELEALWQPL